jgi:holo-[acyl-carrier protein] synthase
MGIIGIGIDIVHTPRVASLVARRTPRKLATRILSPRELREWEKMAPSISATPSVAKPEKGADEIVAERWFRFLAVRWAVKEAAYKALFPLYEPTWKDLTVFKTPEGGGKPSLAYEKFAEVKLHVSVSHDGEYTVANVLAER